MKLSACDPEVTNNFFCFFLQPSALTSSIQKLQKPSEKDNLWLETVLLSVENLE